MSENKRIPEVYRATYLATLQHQEELLEWLDCLVKTDGLITLGERKKWFKLIANALIGTGMHIPAGVTSAELELLNEHEYARVENVEDLLRFLAYVEKKPNGKSITHFWKVARMGVWRAIPLAQEMSTRISPERIPYERSHGYKFRPIKEASE